MERGLGAGTDRHHSDTNNNGDITRTSTAVLPEDIIISATFLAVVLFGAIVVLIVVISWLTNYLDSSSAKPTRHASSVSSSSLRRPVLQPQEGDKRDDFAFKIPQRPNYRTVDESNKEEMDRDAGKGIGSPSSASKSKNEKFVFPESSGASTSDASDRPGMGRFRVPVVDPRWILPRPTSAWSGVYALVDTGGRSDVEVKDKRRSATRSPSLEKDDISPRILSPRVRTEKFDRFAFESGNAERPGDIRERKAGDSSPLIEVRVQPVSTDSRIVESPKPRETTDRQPVRRYGSPANSPRVEIDENRTVEKSEMQNSPRYVDRDNNPSPRFSFSPKFFGTPDSKSPNFFGTPDPKSPTFFADTRSRNGSPKCVIDRSASPRLSSASFKSVQSPLIMDNRPERFTFDIGECADEVDNVFVGSGKSDANLSTLKAESQGSQEEDRLLNNFRKSGDAATRRRSFVRSNANSLNDEDAEINDNKTENYDDRLVPDCPVVSDIAMKLEEPKGETLDVSCPINYRRHRLKSISLDSDNAKFIEQNLGIPIIKHLKQENLYDLENEEKDPISNSYRDDSHDKFRRNTPQMDQYFKFNTNDFPKDYNDVRQVECENSVITIRSSEISHVANIDDESSMMFAEMHPRYSPGNFDSSSGSADDASPKSNKNFRNLTIDLNKKDEDLQKELMDLDCLQSPEEKRMTPKTPTLKVKATSLDSSETLNLSLPQSNTLQVPQNSISVPNTPKRQLQRALSQKSGKLIKGHHYGGNLNEIPIRAPDSYNQRKVFGAKCSNSYIDSGIFLKDNHAPLMPFQGSKYQVHRNAGSCNFSIKMGSFDENTGEMSENNNPNIMEHSENKPSFPQPKCSDNNLLGSNLLNFKQNLSVSSTNLKTLPEGVPSYDFDTQPEEKASKKTLLQRRGSNQSLTINLDGAGNNLKFSTLSLQSSNLSLTSFGASSHNLSNIKNSASNFSLNTDNRQKKNLLERRNSNTSLTLNLDSNQHRGIYGSSNCNLSQEPQSKKCLLQRRGSNTSLTLNLQGVSNTNLNRCTSNSSLNVHGENKVSHKKGLLERRSSNTSLTLNINPSSGPQFDNDRVLSVSNYNLAGLSCHNSNQSIANENKKNLVPREIDIDNFSADTKAEKHRKSLSTENLFPKSYKCRMLHGKNDCENVISFGSHDNLWSNTYAAESFENINSGEQNLTYVCGDQDNEMIYAFGDRQHIESVGPIRNITTKPLSPHSTSADFKTYLANIQHLQNASNSLTRQQLKDLHSIFRGGYAKAEDTSSKNSPLDSITSAMKKLDMKDDKPQEEINEIKLDSIVSTIEYQKTLLRTLHQEFWDLPTNFQEKPMVFGSHPKNRYRSILPNEHSRVILRAENGEVDEGYINANYIKGHEYTKNAYIATQGPLQNTLYDFWLMVYQNGIKFHKQNCMRTNEDRHFGSPQGRNNQFQESQAKTPSEEESGIQKIVMLTNFIESGRSKCEKYFPMELDKEMTFKQFKYSGESGSFGDGSFSPEAASKSVVEGEPSTSFFRVKNLAVINKNGYSIRKLQIEYKYKEETDDSLKIVVEDEPNETIIVYHYWFDNWADHKCPEDVHTLLNFCLDILMNADPPFPVIMKTKTLEKFEIARSIFDKSSTSYDFTVIEKPTNLDLDITGISRERRLSAFQYAKAFFDEAAKTNSSAEDCSKVGIRKNSLASRLDVPKHTGLAVRRESTGRLDCKKKIEIIPQTFKVAQKNVPKKSPPVIVHCSAGIGRTGCLIGTLNGLRQLKADQKVDVLGIVCNMRLNRGGMVQNSEQYELIHKVLCLYEALGLPDID